MHAITRVNNVFCDNGLVVDHLGIANELKKKLGEFKQRFWLGQVGVGFLYLLTWGLLLIGSISDLVRYKTLALLYNQRVAQEITLNMRGQIAREIAQSRTPSPAF